MKKIIFAGLFCLIFIACSSSDSGTENNDGDPSAGTSNVTLNVVGFRSTDAVTSVSAALRAETETAPEFENPVTFASGYINSGAPDYVKLTLTQIAVTVDGTPTTLWSGEEELTIDGVNAVDVSTINDELESVSGTVTQVNLTFKSLGKILGTLTASFNTGGDTEELTLMTKTAYAYDAVNHTGGAEDYSSFEGGEAEEMDFYIGADSDTITVSTNSNETIAQGDDVTLTILFDINRLLRFYDGASATSGFNPGDPADYAYFSGHSLLGNFVAGFFGTPGSIQGYKTYYSVQATRDGFEGVQGWMTVVYDANGSFLSGILIGDDDNALTCAKGMITDYTVGDDGLATFDYNISNVRVTGFEPVTTLNSYSPLATIESFADNTDDEGGSQTFVGEAYYQLIFEQ